MAVCPPLSAIETPRVSDREGYNPKNGAPVYSFGPISEPPPTTPMSSGPVFEDIPATKSSAAHSDPLKGIYFFILITLRPRSLLRQLNIKRTTGITTLFTFSANEYGQCSQFI